MTRISLTRRELLRQTLPDIRNPRRQTPGAANGRWRQVLLFAALLCWLPLLCVSVSHEGTYHATLLTVGIPGSPWLEYRSAGADWSGVMVHVSSWSTLLGVAGAVLWRIYRRPRALPMLRRFFREITR